MQFLIIKTNWLFTLNATRWWCFLPFTFPYTPPRILEKRFSIQNKQIEKILGSIHYISHSVFMPFAHDQYTINWLIIEYCRNITRLSVTFTVMPTALVQMLAARLVIFYSLVDIGFKLYKFYNNLFILDGVKIRSRHILFYLWYCNIEVSL